MEQYYKVQREYKDTIFRMLFREKRELLALYNGLNETAYEDPDLELKVTVLNINPGSNADIMEKCRTLREYSLYVDRVRTHAKKLPIEEAVQRSVDECIEEGILSEFLKVQKSEVIRMSIFEYNEETELKKIREDEYDLGLEAGKRIGLGAGIKALVETCRDLEIPKNEVANRVYNKFSVSREAAAAYVERYW